MKHLLIVLFLLPLFTFAQDKALEVQGTTPNLFLVHTVTAKENYYSIGRLYNISPKVFAPYNKLDMNKGLSPGQVIKIPLNEINFSQGAPTEDGEVLVPVYHTVKDKEGLYRISTTYNKVPVATLEKWNNITGDAVDNGTNLIVGYLKVRKDLSSFASKAVTAAVSSEPLLQTHPAIEKEVVKPVEETKKEEQQVVLPQPVKKELQKEDTDPEVKQGEKKQEPVTVDVATTGKEFNGGVFKTEYSKQTGDKDVVKETGSAATFKSTSGWEDGKYYCLHNTAAPGTIIKVTNATTGKSVYAKVLDVIPDIKQNSGLLIRVSNAAAQQLGISDESKFDCTLEYSK